MPLVPASESSAQAASSPHWKKTECQACHVDAAPSAGNLAFHEAEPELLCESCHGVRGDSKPCRHLSDISLGEIEVPDSLAGSLKAGKLTCTTCHDLSVQCLNPKRSASFINRGFIRGRQSRNRGEFCYQCHEEADYEMLNPHQMEAGDPAQPTCTFCHATMPVRDERGWLSVDFHVEGSLNDLCFGCHRVAPHPGFWFGGLPTWNHLTIPSIELADNMERAQEKYGMKFPVDPNTAEVYCGTCHNPHHESLEDYPVGSSPGLRHRLRVTDNCQACHEM
jgi:hypothetical protein